MQNPDLKLIAAIIAPLLVWPFVPAWDVGYLKDGDVRVLALFLLLPVAEEVVFRGFLQGWLLRLGALKRDGTSSPKPLPTYPTHPSPPLSGRERGRSWLGSPPDKGELEGVGANGFSARLGISGANLATSVAFALAHLWQHPALLFPGYFAVSLVLGYFRERYGGILVPVLLHSYYNLGLLAFGG
jgi:membrane protease YdiL (CAAX protease family)